MGAKRDLWLAANWRVSRVQRCFWKKNRKGLVEFIRDRHEERFFQPIRLLGSAEKNWQGHGFAMMSLCSLLVETLQSYRDGLPTTNPGDLARLQNRFQRLGKAYQIGGLQVSGVAAFRSFFQRFAIELDGIDGEKFYANIRNGLLHQAQTRGGWKINKNRLRLFTAKTIDRDKFALGLEEAFKTYLKELGESKWESDTWRNARRKIWWLIRLS